MQGRIWPRGLSGRGQVVASDAVLAIGLGQTFLEHAVVVPDDR